MIQKAENKLQEFNKKKTEQYYKKKESDLATWGLTAKKGEPPIVITDEEYDTLLKASNGLESRNGVSVLLNIVAITVLVLSLVGAFLMGILVEDSSVLSCAAVVVCGIVFTTLLGGVAEAVKLLQQLIDDKPLEIPEKQAVASKPQPQAQPAAQTPVYQQQPPYAQGVVYQQPPVYQQAPVYQQPPIYQQAPPPAYQPPYNPPTFDEDDIFKANAPVQFGE